MRSRLKVGDTAGLENLRYAERRPCCAAQTFQSAVSQVFNVFNLRPFKPSAALPVFCWNTRRRLLILPRVAAMALPPYYSCLAPFRKVFRSGHALLTYH